MEWWEALTLVFAVLATFVAAATLWLQARRELIEKRSQTWARPLLYNVHDPDENMVITGDAADHTADHFLAEVVNTGTGPMHHLAAAGRGCEIFALLDGTRAVPMNLVHWLPPGDRQPLLIRCGANEREQAWVIFSWRSPDHRNGVFLAWYPIGDGPLLERWGESMALPAYRRWWRRFAPRRWRGPAHQVGPGHYASAYVPWKHVRDHSNAGRTVEDHYAPPVRDLPSAQ